MQFLIIHSVLSLNITNDYLSHKCFLNQGKYNSGSGYEDILNILFGRVRTGDYDITGFRYTSKKTSPLDSASVMLQCRGDSYGSKCRTCADIAVTGFLKRCPKNKGGIIWYEQCFLYVTAFAVPSHLFRFQPPPWKHPTIHQYTPPESVNSTPTLPQTPSSPAFLEYGEHQSPKRGLVRHHSPRTPRKRLCTKHRRASVVLRRELLHPNKSNTARNISRKKENIQTYLNN
ncbi:Gnk2-homologous domain protein [Raphanus sativus]|nr:Gnk2-homologous domain protein [Raphanus sativus]